MELEPLEYAYDYNDHCGDNGYYIQNTEGLDVVGHLVQCNKCGRKIAIDLPLIGSIHHLGPLVTCGDCIDLEKVRAKFPRIADKMEKWLGHERHRNKHDIVPEAVGSGYAIGDEQHHQTEGRQERLPPDA